MRVSEGLHFRYRSSCRGALNGFRSRTGVFISLVILATAQASLGFTVSISAYQNSEYVISFAAFSRLAHIGQSGDIL